MSIVPLVPPDRGQHRSLAVRNWHREALDGWAKAYDLDCSGEFAGKCARCLLDLYVWEDSRDATRSTRYTWNTARSLGVPGFFVLFDADEHDRLIWMTCRMIYPETVDIGGGDEFRRYLIGLRRAHEVIYHDPLRCIRRIA